MNHCCDLISYTPVWFDGWTSHNHTHQVATEGDHAAMVEFLLTHGASIDEGNVFLEPGEESLESKTFKCNVNARDAKGWNATAIACFRHKVRKAKRITDVVLIR